MNQNSSGSLSLSLLRRPLFISVRFLVPSSFFTQSSVGVTASLALKAKILPEPSTLNVPTFILPSVTGSTPPSMLTLWIWPPPWWGNVTYTCLESGDQTTFWLILIVLSKPSVRHLGSPPPAGMTQTSLFLCQTRLGSSILLPTKAMNFPQGDHSKDPMRPKSFRSSFCSPPLAGIS